ncbi:hypothetical protein ACWEK5_34850 [Rhodococcus koreensis]
MSIDSASTNSGRKKGRQVPTVGLIALGVGIAAVAVLVPMLHHHRMPK